MRRTEFERSLSRPGVPATSDYERHKSRRNMKCLVSVGLILPALAAVIGVVAWAVSADIVMGHNRNNVGSPDLRLQDEMGSDAVLQERSDVLYEGRTDGLQMIDNIDIPVSSTIRSEKKEDPPYVVHVVVPQKSSTESPNRVSTQSAVTDVNAFLSKILSASRGSNKILVVPFPGPLPAAVNEEDKSSRFDDEEADSERIIHPEPASSRRPDIRNATGHPLGPQRSGEQPYGEDIRTFHVQNDGEIQQHYQQNGGGLRVQPPPQQHQPPPHQQHQPPPHQQHQPPPHQQHQPPPHQQNHNPPPHQNQPKNPHNPPKSYYQQQAPQQPPPPPPPPPMQQYRPPPHSRPHHPPPNFEQGTGNRAYVPKPAQHQPVPYYEAPNDGQRIKTDRESQQGYDSNRWGSVDGEGYGHGHGHGHEAPKGLTVTFGSGPGPGPGYGGGGYHHHGHHVEPLSMIKSLFLPFLPKPRVNLNGRVVFGVVLEKGVGLGGNKGGSGVSLGGYH